MTNLMNKEYLQGFTVDSLRTIAKEEYNLVVTYKDDNNKRQRFTKPQLIEMIIEAVTAQQTETVVNEIVPATTIKTSNDTEIAKLSINEVVKFALEKVKAINCKNELNEFKQKLLATFEDSKQTKKRTLKKEWALQYNRLTMLFTQAERKLVS